MKAVDKFEWQRTVMRCRLGSTTKLVALALSAFANRNGENAHPGLDRLAAELEVNERTVRRALEKLRTVRLIERTDSGSAYGRRRVADVYRLTQPADLTHLLLSSPATDHRTGESSDDDRNTGHGSPVIEEEHRTEESSDPAGNSGLSRPEHRTLSTDQWTLTTGTPDTGVHPISMTRDLDQGNDQDGWGWVTQPTTGALRCLKSGHEFGGHPCTACAADAKAAS